MSEEHLVRYCAPTLAGIKTGSLFTCPCACSDELRKIIRKLNKQLVPKGLRVLPLRFSDQKALVYVYRPSILRQDLSRKSALQILKENGYCTGTCENCLAQLAQKLQCSNQFPHEIGLFLGYPLEDVPGFIKNNACGCKCTGCWKVYGDVDTARKKFEQYHKCSRVYLKCWKNASSLEHLCVGR